MPIDHNVTIDCNVTIPDTGVHPAELYNICTGIGQQEHSRAPTHSSNRFTGAGAKGTQYRSSARVKGTQNKGGKPLSSNNEFSAEALGAEELDKSPWRQDLKQNRHKKEDDNH